MKNELEIEKKERMNQNKEIRNKIEYMEIEINNLKKELNYIQIGDKVKNLLKSFYYILSPNDIDNIEAKRRKRSDVFNGAFEKKFF